MSSTATPAEFAQPRRRKILFVINSLAGGGAERVMSSIIAASDHMQGRFDIGVVLLDDEPSAYTLPDWVKVFPLQCKGGLLCSTVRLWSLLRRLKPDITLSFLTRANVACAVVMGWRRRPYVLSERVNTTAHLGEGRSAVLSKLLVKATYPRASKIIAVSEGVATTLVDDFRVSPTKLVALSNPVPAQQIAERAAEAPPFDLSTSYIIAMGRLVPNKNFGLAIRAFARTSPMGQLVIIGEGPERANLEQLGRDLGVADRLCMPGFVANPYPLIAGAAFMVLSSNAEGFPNALVEALACGKPVVATDCPSGPAEVLQAIPPQSGEVSEGRGGLLVPVDDDVAMAAAFEAMKESARRTELSRAGLERVQDFSVEATVDRYWSVIQEALDR